ncbi:unnamed protein product [Allacma fusca]|uniref:Uncharacterized protein n=1 Tax=Allacma fusca TaxID=39272 RepID=A0A8J2JSG3_9HEXA|nr:unnamed protein product [Allacma fusca]
MNLGKSADSESSEPHIVGNCVVGQSAPLNTTNIFEQLSHHGSHVLEEKRLVLSKIAQYMNKVKDVLDDATYERFAEGYAAALKSIWEMEISLKKLPKAIQQSRDTGKLSLHRRQIARVGAAHVFRSPILNGCYLTMFFSWPASTITLP